jgi:threonine/homoserine/homoserine lactone efflux protein
VAGRADLARRIAAARHRDRGAQRKTAIWYASVFAAFLPRAPSLGFDVAIAIAVFLIETGWYTLVALALSAERPRQVYLRFKPIVDRTAGAIVVALGLKLIVSARP